MAKTPIPIFIFSLPRSGSTLAQKILSSHPDVASLAEPWLLLPLVYALRDEGIYTEYAQCLGGKAIREFIRELPAGEPDYYTAVGDFVRRLYGSAVGDGVPYFLDKTPRYHLILNEILDIFPGAKCILLWRNPLAIAASILDTWGKNGRWNLYRYKIDLYKGIENLVEAAKNRPERFIQINYEDMISNPAIVWPKIFSYLRLDYDPSVLDRYSAVTFSGSMGDPTGHKKFSGISTESIDRWRGTFDSRLRKAWARSYIEWLGSERLQIMGYEKKEILRELDGLSKFGLSKICSDALFMSIGALHAPIDMSGVKRGVKCLLSHRRCYAST